MSDKINALPWKLWKPNDLTQNRSKGIFEPLQIDELVNDESVSSEADENSDSSAAEFEFIDHNELQVLRHDAEQQGHKAGYETGHKLGYQAGFNAGQEAGHAEGLLEGQQQQQVLTTQWQHLVVEFQQTLDELDSVIASRLMQMALTAAKQILGQPPICDGSALLNQIQQLIQQEPMFSGKPHIRVNPADFERVEQQMGNTLNAHGWRLLADSQIHSGGCKVSAEDGDMDATLATRWHELCRLVAPGDLS